MRRERQVPANTSPLRPEPVPPAPPVRSASRLLEGAGLRRVLVYILAAVLILYAGLTAVRLAAPPDPYGPIRVETLPGYSGTPGAEPTKVTYDAATGHTVLEVTQPDGSVKRFRVTRQGEEGWRVYEAPE